MTLAAIISTHCNPGSARNVPTQGWRAESRWDSAEQGLKRRAISDVPPAHQLTPLWAIEIQRTFGANPAMPSRL
jgi:hypothetical protein